MSQETAMLVKDFAPDDVILLPLYPSIIDAHWGQLWVEANEPRGAVFPFTLPGAEVRS